MRISRHGTHRHRGLSLLARTEPASGQRPTLFPEWNEETQRLQVVIRGVASGSTSHTYRVEISVNELAEMIEEVTKEGAKDRSARALGKGMAAFLRDALAPPEAGPSRSS
jgi:hypothetical protein